jgi:predicted DNA-binding protein (MmcQ/YjbR family)
MVTAAQMRKLALALPEAEEKSRFEQPDFRVRNKIFAGLSRDGTQGNLKLAPELQALVLSSNPEAFSPATGAWGRSGWTMVKLAQVSAGELAELLKESHALVGSRAKPRASKKR